MAAYRRVCGGFCGALQSFESLEKHLLDGQKLQGPPTAADVYRYQISTNQLRTKANWSVWDDDDYTVPHCAHAAQNVSTNDMK